MAKCSGNSIQKTFEELTYSSDFLFGVVMQDKEICREVLETLLDIEIEKVVKTEDVDILETQKTIDLDYSAKSVRLDVYLKNSNIVYNIEMQTNKNKNLPLRCRYYQDLIDLNLLSKGELYTKLKETYIIFICTFDPFNEELPRYTFKTQCVEKAVPAFDDKTNKIFFNATAYKKVTNKKLRSFLKYVNGEVAETKLTKRIDNTIADIKNNKKVRGDYMTLHTMLLESKAEGEAEGEAKGKAEGKAEGEIRGKIKTATTLVRFIKTLPELKKEVDLPDYFIEKIMNKEEITEEEIENLVAETLIGQEGS